MNIYYVSIHKDTKGTIHDTYYGEASCALDAIHFALQLARKEAVKDPIVGMCKLEGKKRF